MRRTQGRRRTGPRGAPGSSPGGSAGAAPWSGPVEGYLAHKKPPTPLGLPQDPEHRDTVTSYGRAVSDERGTPVCHFIVRLERDSMADDSLISLKLSWCQLLVRGQRLARASHQMHRADLICKHLKL